MRIIYQLPPHPANDHTYVTSCQSCDTKVEFRLGEATVHGRHAGSELNALEHFSALKLNAKELSRKLIQVECPVCFSTVHVKYNSYKKTLPQLLIDKLRTCW